MLDIPCIRIPAGFGQLTLQTRIRGGELWQECAQPRQHCPFISSVSQSLERRAGGGIQSLGGGGGRVMLGFDIDVGKGGQGFVTLVKQFSDYALWKVYV